MLLGPIFRRELLTASRQSKLYAFRAVLALLTLTAIGANYYGWREYRLNDGVFSTADLARYAQTTFFSIVGLQLVVTLVSVPSLVASAIVEEKERKTLHYLLASQLTSVEIVVGKLAARLLQYVVGITATLPIQYMLTLMGGFQPEWVLLAYAGTLSIAVLLGGMAILISVLARRTRGAMQAAACAAGMWFIAPFILMILRLAAVVPAPVWRVIDPIDEGFIRTSPMHLLSRWVRGMGRMPPGIEREVLEMMATCWLYCGLFLLLAVWRLRPAFRRQEGSSERRVRVFRRFRRRFGCGDYPMVWKECFTGLRARGLGRLLAALLTWFFLALVGIFAYRLSAPIFAAIVYGDGMQQGLSARRENFNIYLRIVTSILIGLYALLIAGVAATSITVERERDTWEGLLTTPMPSREIILGKMLGAVWQMRWMGIVIGLLWLLGLAAGSLHPVGVVVALVELAVFLWFASALGVWCSLRAKNTSQASSWAGGLLMIAGAIGPLAAWLLDRQTVLAWFACMPALESFTLFWSDDLAEGIGQGNVTYLRKIGFGSGESALRAIVACLLGILFYTGAAALFTSWAIRGFDRVVGRPRAKTAGEVASATPPLPAEPRVAVG